MLLDYQLPDSQNIPGNKIMIFIQKNGISNKLFFSTFSCKQSLRRGDSSSFLFFYAYDLKKFGGCRIEEALNGRAIKLKRLLSYVHLELL
jgi:hypothetical protein